MTARTLIPVAAIGLAVIVAVSVLAYAHAGTGYRTTVVMVYGALLYIGAQFVIGRLFRRP